MLGARSLQFSYDQEATYQEVKGLSATKRLSSFTSTNLGEGDALPVVDHEMGDLPFLFQGCGGDQIFLCEGWSELHLFFLSVCFLPSFEKAEGYSPCHSLAYREKGGLFLPMEEQLPCILGRSCLHINEGFSISSEQN